MANVHNLTYCHICTDNIVLFSRERKTYTRDALQRHIRYGDRDDRSLKGHPSCLFCEQRFFDEEHRYRHLRKEHFFCQFCESDGKQNTFFGDRDGLMGHYKAMHFVCEVEECRAMGIAFSSQIDLNLHKSSEHSTRRTALALDFQYNDRQLAGSSRSRREIPSAQDAPIVRRDKISVIQQEQTPQLKRPNQYIVVPSAQRSNRSVLCNVAPAYTPQSEDFPSLGNSSGSLTSLRPDNFPRLNRVNRSAVPAVVAQSTASDSPSGAALSFSKVIRKNRSVDVVEDFPALSASRGQGSVTSVWDGKKILKPVVAGCMMPNDTKTLPEPDIWPQNVSAASTTEADAEQWQQVPGKSRKLEKKQPKAWQKSVSDVSIAEQKPLGKESKEPPPAFLTNIERNSTLNESTNSNAKIENMLREFTNIEIRKDMNRKRSRTQVPILTVWKPMPSC
ncbi:hypothetical protein KIN20_032285 [Parelaphostrongylus tenuis]|nr:hypothetical protein KIN20_032285 [Parelaphostrongylus tenuis]